MKALIRAEFAKCTALRHWWYVPIGLAAATLLTCAWNSWQCGMFLRPFEEYLASAVTVPVSSMDETQISSLRNVWIRQSDLRMIASTLYTSGQFIALLVVALVGASFVTSEFSHRVIGATFLITPRRGRVVLAKLVTVVIVSIGLWFISTLLSVAGGAIFLHSRSVDVLPQGAVGSILWNLAAYALWGLLGFGVGVLFRRQTLTAIVITVAYLASAVGSLIFQAIHEFLIHSDTILKMQVLVPGIASQILTKPVPIFPESPSPWVAGVVLVSYAGVATLVGCWKLSREDV